MGFTQAVKNWGRRGMSMAYASVVAVAIVALAVGLRMYSVLVPEVQSAGQTLNGTGVGSNLTGIPLGSLFGTNGVIVLIVMAALVFAILRAFFGSKSGRNA